MLVKPLNTGGETMKRERLIELRKQKDWTQEDLVEELKNEKNIEITASFYGMIERGVRNPTLNLAIAISDLFDVSIESIFFYKENNKLLNGNNHTA